MTLANRFQVLAQLQDANSNVQPTYESTNAAFNFKGNKNGKGQTLGSMSDNSTNNCDAKEKINIKPIPSGSYFDLKYPSVDHIVDSLKELGTGALLYKINIKRAFRYLTIDPGDLDLLGLKHDQYYIDGNLPFGFRHGSVFFQCCSDAIRFIMVDTFGIRTYTTILMI